MPLAGSREERTDNRRLIARRETNDGNDARHVVVLYTHRNLLFFICPFAIHLREALTRRHTFEATTLSRFLHKEAQVRATLGIVRSEQGRPRFQPEGPPSGAISARGRGRKQYATRDRRRTTIVLPPFMKLSLDANGNSF